MVCPHFTLEEITETAKLLEGKKIHNNITLILGTSEIHRILAKKMGLVDIIEEARGFVLPGICTSSFPRRAVPQEYKGGVIATDSANAAHYIGVSGVEVWIGSIEKCIKGAIEGMWES